MTPADLVTAWRERARALEPYAAPAATAFTTAAAELEQAIQAAGDDVLTLEEAAKVSGYSIDHLRHLVADGTIPNAGGPRRPRIARRDVPKRAQKHQPASAYSPDADALRLVSSHRPG